MSSLTIRKPLLGAAILAITAAIWSTFGVLVRFLGYNIPFFYGAWTRNLAAALILFLAVLIFKQFKPMTWRDLSWSIIRSVTGMFGLIGSFVGFLNLSIGTAYFMYFSGMTLGSFILGKLLFQEKMTVLKIVSFFLAMVGMALVYGVSIDQNSAFYLWMIFFSGWAGAFWSVSSKKVSDKYSTVQLNALDFLIFGILALVISILRQEVWSWPTLTVPWLVNLTFLIMFIITGQLVILGFKHIDAQRGGLILLLEVVLGTALGALIFHEQLSPWAKVGGALILAAAALPEVGELLKKRKITTS